MLEIVSFLFFLTFFFLAQAFEDELRKDQNCLAEEYANENANSGEQLKYSQRKYKLSMSCASDHAAEKYELVFQVPRRQIKCLSQNIEEVYTLK